MEIQLVIGLAVIGIIAYLLLTKRKTESTQSTEVAVELPVLQTAVEPKVEPIVETVVETVVAVNPVAVALDLEPAVLETPAKKPRKPRAAKVEVTSAKTKAVKSVAKKAAPKKEAAKKPAARTVKSKKV
jgi:hypothetical protein